MIYPHWKRKTAVGNFLIFFYFRLDVTRNCFDVTRNSRLRVRIASTYLVFCNRATQLSFSVTVSIRRHSPGPENVDIFYIYLQQVSHHVLPVKYAENASRAGLRDEHFRLGVGPPHKSKIRRKRKKSFLRAVTDNTGTALPPRRSRGRAFRSISAAKQLKPRRAPPE